MHTDGVIAPKRCSGSPNLANDRGCTCHSRSGLASAGSLLANAPQVALHEPSHRDFRAGDVRHSQADIGKAARLLGYAPTHDLDAGLAAAMPWYVEHAGR